MSPKKGLASKSVVLLTIASLLLGNLATTYAQPQSDQEGFIDSDSGQDLKRRREKAKEECELEQQQEQEQTPQSPSQIDSVPVQEVGELLTVTKETNKEIKEIKKLTTELKDLQIQICTHLKVIRDMQLAMEEKEFKFDPDAAAARAQAIHNHKLAIAQNLAGLGYEISPALATGQAGGQQQNKQPLQPPNLEEHLSDVEKETYGVFKGELQKISDAAVPFKKEIVERLDKDQSSNLQTSIKASDGWTKDKYDKFVNATPQEFTWNDFLTVIQPKNNPDGSYLIAEQEFLNRKRTAEQNAREELLASGGILPTRICDEWITDEDGNKYCKKWKTQITGSIIRDYIVAVLTSLLRQFESSDENMEDRLKAELENIAKDLRTKNLAEIGQKSKFDENNPCPGPGPCPETGWEPEKGNRPPEPPAGGGSGGGQPPDFNGREFQNNLGQGINEGFTNVPGNLPAEVQNSINQDIRTGLPEALGGIDFRNFDNYQQFQLQQTLDDFLGGVLQRNGVNEEQPRPLQKKLWQIILNLILSLIGWR